MDHAPITLTVRVPMEVRPKRVKAPAGERPLFQGTADDVIHDIRRYADLGVTHFVWDPTHQDMPSVLDNLERFAHDVAGAVAAGGARSRRTGARPTRRRARTR